MDSRGYVIFALHSIDVGGRLASLSGVSWQFVVAVCSHLNAANDMPSISKAFRNASRASTPNPPKRRNHSNDGAPHRHRLAHPSAFARAAGSHPRLHTYACRPRHHHRGELWSPVTTIRESPPSRCCGEVILWRQKILHLQHQMRAASNCRPVPIRVTLLTVVVSHNPSAHYLAHTLRVRWTSSHSAYGLSRFQHAAGV